VNWRSYVILIVVVRFFETHCVNSNELSGHYNCCEDVFNVQKSSTAVVTLVQFRDNDFFIILHALQKIAFL